MQKKKFPVLPVIGIVAVLSVLFLMNATNGNINLSKLFASNDNAQQVKEAVARTTKESTKSQMMASMNRKDPTMARANPDGLDPTENQLPTEPAIFLPKQTRRVETPNESATSSQWYKKGSEVEQKGEEVKKERDASQ